MAFDVVGISELASVLISEMYMQDFRIINPTPRPKQCLQSIYSVWSGSFQVPESEF